VGRTWLIDGLRVDLEASLRWGRARPAAWYPVACPSLPRPRAAVSGEGLPGPAALFPVGPRGTGPAQHARFRDRGARCGEKGAQDETRNGRGLRGTVAR